jgi:integrase
MPAEQRGQLRKLDSGKYQLRFYDREGSRRTGGVFPSRTAALNHYRDVIEPQLNGTVTAEPLTLRQLVELFLARQAAVRSPRTVRGLRERLQRPLASFGDTPLPEFERMSGDLADFRSTLPERFAHDVMRALRQVCAAGVRWGHIGQNPATLAGANPAPPSRTVRVYTVAEVDALEQELGERYGPIVPFAAATGLRPQEWAALERGDVDRDRRVVAIRRVISNGEIRSGAKTTGSVREVPLTRRALDALDRVPPRLDTRVLFPNAAGRNINLHNFGRREWRPAVEASGIATPARIYDLRSTFASNALAANVTPFELAKVMGTSVAMIERHYGALIGGAHAGITGRLDRLEAELERAAEAETGRLGHE